VINRKIHNDYIAQNGSTEINTYGVFFQSEELWFLTKYFKWGLGLVNGNLYPVSKEQENFISVFRNYVKLSNTPPQKQDKWYTMLNKYQKTWIRYYFIVQLKEKINDYTISKDPQSIFINESDIVDAITGKNMSTEKVANSKFCSKCKNFKGITEHHLCNSCRIPKPKKKKLKRGSITTNRSSFSGRKWNDDKHRDNHNRSSLDRDL